MTEISLLEEYLNRARHNLFCYSRDWAMSQPKKGHEIDWEQAGVECEILERMSKKLKVVEETGLSVGVPEFCEQKIIEDLRVAEEIAQMKLRDNYKVILKLEQEIMELKAERYEQMAGEAK